MSAKPPFLGKYRGTVLQNNDPEMRGRLQLEVPGVTALLPTTWAEACVPLAGPTGPPMGVYMVPAIGTGVWVEFEKGEAKRPIGTGCRWGSTADVPSMAKLSNPADPNIVFTTLLQHTLMLSDLPPTPVSGGIVLQSTGKAMIVVNDSGIYLSNGKGATITLIGTAIDFNNGALTILK